MPVSGFGCRMLAVGEVDLITELPEATPDGMWWVGRTAITMTGDPVAKYRCPLPSQSRADIDV